MSVADKKTSKEAWEAIRTVHLRADKVKKAKVHTIKSEFEALTMKESEQLDEFGMRLNGLVTNIRAWESKLKKLIWLRKSFELYLQSSCR